MKSRNTFILFGVLVILVLVYLAVSYFGSDNRSKSFRSELVEIKKDEVTRIEIKSGGSSMVLNEGPENWQVQLADGKFKPAKAANVNSLLSTLSSIVPSRIASRSSDQWSDFQVDSAGMEVIVFEGGSKSLDIIVGRFGMEGQRSFYTYVRLADEQDTYVVNDFMSMSISKDPNAYRNNEILRSKKDSITSISFNYPDDNFTIIKSDGGWLIGNAPADSTNMASYLSGLSLVTSRLFTESMGEPSNMVTFQFSNQDDIAIAIDDNNSLSTSYNEHEYFSDSTVTQKLFKDRSYFLP
ncbi:MAG: DUF4340 domain-containing protein [Bacteroidota bacterium]